MSILDISNRFNPFSNKKGGSMRKETTVILIVIIAMASFFGFYPLFAEFKEPAAQAFGAAIFGTIFTIVLTMFLLKTQTEVSQTSERSQVVFQEQVKLFKSIIDKLERCFKDGKITQDEMPEMTFMLIKLNMLATDETISSFNDLYKEVFNNPELDPDTESDIVVGPELMNKLVEFTNKCRKELGLADLAGKGAKFENQQDAELQKEIKETMQTIEKARSEERITYGGWAEFEKEQGKDPQRKPLLPLAKMVHDLLITALNENKLSFEPRYGGGTFSFSVPKNIAKKTNTRTCATFGLLGLSGYPWLKNIYKEAADPLPKDAKHYTKNGSEIPTRYYINFKSEAAVQEMESTIKDAIIKSYKLLAK